MAAPHLRKRAPPNIGMVPKSTAGLERKKLWLIERNNKAQAKTTFARTTPFEDSQQNRRSLQRPMSAMEKRESLIHEKAEQIKLKESR